MAEILMDEHSESEMAYIHPLLRTKIRAMSATYQAAGNPPFHVVQGLRTYAQQNVLFNQRPVVTKARGGYSNHNFGIAVDLAPGLPGKPIWTPDWKAADNEYQTMVKHGLAQGLVSGSVWKSITDWPHFQLPGIPVTPNDAMRATFLKGGLAQVWKEFVPSE